MVVGGIVASAIGGALISALKSIAKGTLIFGSIILVFSFLPFKFELPTSLYDLFVGGDFFTAINMVGYFLPMGFLLTCFAVRLGCRYYSVIFSLLSTFYSFMRDLINSL